MDRFFARHLSIDCVQKAAEGTTYTCTGNRGTSDILVGQGELILLYPGSISAALIYRSAT
jgi:hypothetical protein